MKTITHASGSVMLAMAMITLIGCGSRQEAEQSVADRSKPVVISANYPLHYFSRRIGGDLIDPLFLVPPDGDPAYWEPTANDITRMQQANLILLNGAGYEKWLSIVSLPDSRVVDTSTRFADQYISEESGATHQHGPGGEHTHGETAFTTWLDLSLAIVQANEVKRVLVELLPEEESRLQENLAELTNELAMLDLSLHAWGQSTREQPLLASHPVYQYFARRYSLNLKSVHWEPDEVPDAAAWRELDALLEDHPARWMIWEGQPKQDAVQQLSQRGVTSVVFNPYGNQPEVGDFLSAMRQNVENLRN